MMSEIKLIQIGDLEHHPENPRKDLGDLTELTESMRDISHSASRRRSGTG